LRNSISPRVMRETSIKSSTSRTMCDTCRSIMPCSLCRLRIVAFGGAQDVQAVAQRRERIAQLVGEGGEEFVLAAVGGTQVFQRLAALDQVGGWRARMSSRRRSRSAGMCGRVQCVEIMPTICPSRANNGVLCTRAMPVRR
jgi:hypothetical protein